MAKKNKPDKLAREAAQALAANMSYGKWKALQPVVAVDPNVLPDKWKRCEYCGKPFKYVWSTKRFCEISCQQRAYAEKQKKAQAEK